MRKFRFIEHMGDIGMEVSGSDLKALFRHAAEAFTEVVTDAETVRARRSQNIFLRGEQVEDLLVRWLNELIFLFDAKGLLFSVFEVVSVDECHIEATIRGEVFDKDRHPIKTTVKGATYHLLEVARKEEIWTARIVMDL